MTTLTSQLGTVEIYGDDRKLMLRVLNAMVHPTLRKRLRHWARKSNAYDMAQFDEIIDNLTSSNKTAVASHGGTTMEVFDVAHLNLTVEENFEDLLYMLDAVRGIDVITLSEFRAIRDLLRLVEHSPIEHLKTVSDAQVMNERVSS